MLATATDLQRLHPQHFRLLSETPALLCEHTSAAKGRQHYRRLTPLLRVNHRQQVVAAHLSYPFQGQVMLDGAELRAYLRAYCRLEAMLGERQLKCRLQAGDVLLFNNRRMVHTREAQSVPTQRLAKLHYVNIDDFRSRAVVVHEEVGEMIAPRVGNGDWL